MSDIKIGNAYLNVTAKPDADFDSSATKLGTGFGSKFGSSMKHTMSVAFGNILAGLADAAAAALKDFFSDSIDAGMGFESSMSQVAATFGYTTAQLADSTSEASANYEALAAKAKEMGAATSYSASQAADGLNILAMSGFDANQSIDMLEDVLHLAAAGSMDLSQAAGYVSGAMKGFADDTKGAQYYADLMAVGATKANTSVAQLGDAMSSGAAGAAAYSQNAESMTIALLRLAEQGDVGAAAGTALAATMKDLYTPSDQAKKALEKLGVAAYEDGKALDFNDVVNNLAEALSGMSEEEANAYKQTIFGIQGLNAFNKMTVTGTEKQKEWAEALAHASDGAGAAAEQYNTMTDNLKGSTDAFNSALEGVQITVFGYVEPALRAFVDGATNLLGVVNEALGSSGVSGAFDAMGGAVMTVMSPIVQFVRGNVIPLVTQVADAVIPVVVGIGAVVGDVMNSIFDIVGSVLEGVTGAMEDCWPYVQDIVELVSGTIKRVSEDVWPAVSEFVKTAGGAIKSVIDAVFPAIKIVVSTVFATIQAIAEGVWPAVSGAVEGAGAVISGVISGFTVFVDIVRNTFDGIKNAIEGPINLARDAVRAAIEAIKGFFRFDIQWPHIPVPRFYISPAGWGIGDLLQGSIPSLGIDWYAKGGFVDGATLIGAGEAGPEMILPKQGELMEDFAERIAEKMGGGITVNNMTVVTPDPEDFMRQLTAFAARTRAQYA